MLARLRLAAIVAAALLGACKSDEEKLLDLRTDLRDQLDDLYEEYGGGDLASQAKTEADKAGAADEGSSTAARLVGEMDRSWFEGYCLARGRGERPFNLSGKLEAFMKDSGHERACREAARLQARIQELEARTPR